MITTTVLLVMTAGQPTSKQSISSPTLRQGRIGAIDWSAPAECGELEEAAGESLPELVACNHSYHIWVEYQEEGWVGHRRWHGSVREETSTNKPQPDCRVAMRYLVEQAATYCETAATEEQQPLPPEHPPHSGVPPEPPVIPPAPPPTRDWSPWFTQSDLSLLGGFGRDDQALGRGGFLGMGYDGGRWRVMAIVGYEQLFIIGEERSIMTEIAERSTRFIRGGPRVCYELSAGGNDSESWDIAIPVCGGFGVGQIRDPGTPNVRTAKTMWSGVEGSLSLVVKRRGPIAFRAGLDVVISLPRGNSIGPFYEPGDVGARLFAGLEIPLGRPHPTYRKKRRQAR